MRGVEGFTPRTCILPTSYRPNWREMEILSGFGRRVGAAAIALDHGRLANVGQALVQILVASQFCCHNNHPPLFLSSVLLIIDQV